jgi:heme/copper-type cytochrome/quinol oxidase subunit 4
MLRYLVYFFTGGTVVTITVLLAEMGHPFLSGLALVFLTAISFYFIGVKTGSQAVSKAALSALLTSIVVWTPYIFIVIRYSPRWGVTKALLVGIFVFLVVGSGWVLLNRHYGFW